MLKVDLHCHTLFSDGRHGPKLMLEAALKKGLDGIAITDHDTFRGYTYLKRENLASRVIPGIEVSTEYGHVVMLCHNEVKVSRNLRELVDIAKAEQCFLFPSHPYDITRDGIGEKAEEFPFSGIEVYNPKAPAYANRRALETARKMSIQGLANSDSHVYYALGSAYNIIEGDEFSTETVLTSLFKGKAEPVAVGLTTKAKIEIAKWFILRHFEGYTGISMRKM